MAQQGQNVAAQAAGADGGPGNRTPDNVLELLKAELHLDERDMAYLYDYLSSALYRVEADEVEVKLTMSVEASQCRRRGDCTAVTYLTPREALALALRLIAAAEAAISNEKKIVESI
ncbi:MAG: hypothetical protein RXR02_07220 [Thermoproteus sp.]